MNTLTILIGLSIGSLISSYVMDVSANDAFERVWFICVGVLAHAFLGNKK